MAMSDEEFQRLVNGPLSHPMIPFRISRLVLALADVVSATGDAGAEALRRHCMGRARQDLSKGGYPDDWPMCPVCFEPAMDGHITCGKATCDEGAQRRKTHVAEHASDGGVCPECGTQWVNHGETCDTGEKSNATE